MEVKFADTFFESLEKLSRTETWYYKTYSFFRYDIPRFLKNLWRFKKALWNFHSWDYHYSLEVFRTSLELLESTLITGNEIEITRNKKVEKIQRIIEIIKHVEDDSYIEIAENELGEIKKSDFEFIESKDNSSFSELVDDNTDEENAHNKKVFDRSNEIESSEWIEFCNILKGQDLNNFNKEDNWDDQFDGSGLKGWWN